MKVVVWLVEGTWEAAVDAAAEWPGDVELVHVVAQDVEEVWQGGPVGLMGRGAHSSGSPLLAAAEGLLARAAQRLGRPARTTIRHGREEVEVLESCAGADLLVCSRDGDLRRRGPRSLGRATRYVVDHAPCAVLLVWPGDVPQRVDLPPAPLG